MNLSIQQLQSIDFILKRITLNSDYPLLYKKNLKLVVEINDSYWYGDFVRMEGSKVFQYYIDNAGDVEVNNFSVTGSNAVPTLSKIWKAYTEATKGSEGYHYFSNPFKSISDLPLLFDTLLWLLSSSEVDNEDSSIFPYLHNARKIDNTLELPFIYLKDELIKLISIVEIND
ncbi:hypothetical protein FZC76_15975 [Sutcliffiella horikoshii]|uniref:Uncharacterized protein n=1 Tax=Sutcliffiella horikoshii TaxID=79883 RepID=A0A5D4SUL2_9BACI|nr:hypothetical protein [Sutcliffiella horikoshii]TYS67025.1 hypothetical protein FZC76_15975 [Sutcliffiella horikoshii]